MGLFVVLCTLLLQCVVAQYHIGEILHRTNIIYPEIETVTRSHHGSKMHKNNWHVTNHDVVHMDVNQRRQRRDGMFGNFDPNAFNSQIGANFNPNAFGTGSGSSGTNMFNMMGNGMSGTSSGSGSTGGSSTGGTSMFNPNVMTGTNTGGTSGSNSGATNTGTSTMSGGIASSGTSGTSTGGAIPSYDPNNVINTGAKYDPNAANSGMGGSGGASPSFANGMGLNATQKLPTGGGPFGSATGSGNGGSSTPGSGSGGSSAPGSGSTSSNPASAFGSATSSSGSAASSFGSPSGASTSGASATSGSTSSGSSSIGSASSGSGVAPSGGSSSTGSGAVSMGSGSTSSGSPNMVPPGTGGATSGGSTSSGGSGFDPIATNSMATSGFNPLNPMMGKDMNMVMGPQTSTGNTGPGNFDPSKMNAQLGSQGMSLNMFGGAGGNTNLNKADAGAVMNGASGMMAGSNAINNGGNAVMSGGNTGAGTGMTSGGAKTGTSSTSGSSTFDPNKMSSGSGTGSSTGSGTGSSTGSGTGSSTGSGTGSSTGSGTGSGSSGSSSSFGTFDPNAMMGETPQLSNFGLPRGSVNPMMPGGGSGMNPIMPGGGSGTNPMMPGGGSMTGTSTGTRGSSGSTGLTSGSSSTPLDPLGAMTGGAQKFSGGNNLIDPMGFMQGGGLTGGMGNKFALVGREINYDVDAQSPSEDQQRPTTLQGILTGSRLYNPMDPMGFIFEGNNQQFTVGNGRDTGPYDPNKYAFTYAAHTFGGSDNNLLPGIANTQATHQLDNSQSTIAQTTDDHNDTQSVVTTNSKPALKQQTLFGLPVMSMRPSESLSATLPDNILDNIRVNASSMFPEVAFNGYPGMLGVGTQTPVEKLHVDQVSTPVPHYSGYPVAWFTEGQKTNDGSVHALANGSYKATKDSSTLNEDGHTNTDTSSNNFIAMPSVSGNWRGEWPGKTTSNKDWSGSWSDKWPSVESESKDVDTHNTTHVQHDGHTSSLVDWDGSWPGSQNNNMETSTSTNTNTMESISDMIASLEKLMHLLKNSTPSQNHNSDNTNEGEGHKTFNQMASSWKDDIKSL